MFQWTMLLFLKKKTLIFSFFFVFFFAIGSLYCGHFTFSRKYILTKWFEPLLLKTENDRGQKCLFHLLLQNSLWDVTAASIIFIAAENTFLEITFGHRSQYKQIHIQEDRTIFYMELLLFWTWRCSASTCLTVGLSWFCKLAAEDYIFQHSRWVVTAESEMAAIKRAVQLY